jgi:hypothetical protein
MASLPVRAFFARFRIAEKFSLVDEAVMSSLAAAMAK